MANNTIKMRIQNKNDSSFNWSNNNPVLKSGELGFDELGRAKVGDGVSTWNELHYINDVTKLTAITDTEDETNIFYVSPDIDNRVYYFIITKDTTLNFLNASDKLFFIEKRIYIEYPEAEEGEEEKEPIQLELQNAEWANDEVPTIWGNQGRHLYLQATWIAGRIIVEVIDNDQLADNQL